MFHLRKENGIQILFQIKKNHLTLHHILKTPFLKLYKNTSKTQALK